MDLKTVKRGLFSLLALAGTSLALFSLYLLSRTAQNSDDFDRLHISILSINIVGVLVLLVLMIGNLARLLREFRTNVPGSRLKARIVGMFVALAVLPLLVLFYFSYEFINRGIDTWFDVQVEEGLDNALRLSQAVLEIQKREHLFDTQRAAQRLAEVGERQLIFELSLLRRESGAREMTLFGENARIIATSSDSASAGLPEPLTDEVLLQAAQNRPFVTLDPMEDGRYEIRTAALLMAPGGAEAIGIVQAHFPVTERLGRMTSSVENSLREYQQLLFLREPLKITLTLTLTVVLLLSLLTAIYGAFILARRLVQPIQDLVAGTRAVAKGDFDTRLPTPARDEIGFLISSFNDMTQRLAAARREASVSQAQVEAERSNLEVILARLTTGVVALDSDLRIRTANQASGAILNVEPRCAHRRKPGRCCGARTAARAIRGRRTRAHPRRRDGLAGTDRAARRRGEARADLRVHDTAGGRGRRAGLCHRVRRHHRTPAGAARCGLGRSRAAPRA